MCVWDGIIRNISVWDGISGNIIKEAPVADFFNTSLPFLYVSTFSPRIKKVAVYECVSV